MDALEVVRTETKFAYAWLEDIVKDITPEQATWEPWGTANTIAATYAHLMIWADVDLMRNFHGRPPLLAGDWGSLLGHSPSSPDEWAHEGDYDWDMVRRYGHEVQAQVWKLVDELTVEDLERRVPLAGSSLGDWSGIDVYTLHGWRHLGMHGGEIACLKGLQGLTGYLR